MAEVTVGEVSEIPALSERLGPDRYQKRIQGEEAIQCGLPWQGDIVSCLDEHWIPGLLKFLLKATGLYRRGRRNFRDLRVRKNLVEIGGLPTAFEGYTLLHLTDLHIDLDLSLAPSIIESLQGLEYDLCVITGDFRSAVAGKIEPALEQMALLMPHFHRKVYGVLGNHDFIEMVPGLESMGIRMLLNESVAIEQSGEVLHLVGVDDPHFYQTDDLGKALRGIPIAAPKILLAHSPEAYSTAAAAECDLLLCGHTHGGQICWPGGRAVLRNESCPRPMVAGAWSHRGLRGYTSVGTGASAVPIRFNCPPEITLHELRPSTEE